MTLQPGQEVAVTLGRVVVEDEEWSALARYIIDLGTDGTSMSWMRNI